jgi:hypothetical protein
MIGGKVTSMTNPHMIANLSRSEASYWSQCHNISRNVS